jgi:polyphosphate kinase
MSANIYVMSLIGPFLEHSRIFYFRNGQTDPIDGRFFMGSADWMGRNLLGRVEVVAPIEDKLAREKVWETLTVLLNDQRLVWDMDASGDYRLRQPQAPEQEVGAHDLLIEKMRIRAAVRKLEDAKS